MLQSSPKRARLHTLCEGRRRGREGVCHPFCHQLRINFTARKPSTLRGDAGLLLWHNSQAQKWTVGHGSGGERRADGLGMGSDQPVIQTIVTVPGNIKPSASDTQAQAVIQTEY